MTSQLPEEEHLKTLSDGYQVLFRYIIDGMRQQKGGQVPMNEVKPYLLNFEDPFPNTPISIFPTSEVRRNYIDAAFDLYNQGKISEAKVGFYFLSSVVDNDPNIFLGLGSCFLIQGQQEEAKDLFEKAEQIMPSFVQATVLKIRSYVELGMKPAAQAALYSALDDAERQSDEERFLLLRMVGQQLKLQVLR